jgi:hypothetical protein
MRAEKHPKPYPRSGRLPVSITPRGRLALRLWSKRWTITEKGRNALRALQAEKDALL